MASFRAYPDGSTAGQNEMALHSLASQIIDFNGRIPSELRTALTAIREARGTVDLLAKLTGGLRGSESEEQIPGSEPTVEELRSLVVSGMEIQQRRREPDSRTVEAVDTPCPANPKKRGFYGRQCLRPRSTDELPESQSGESVQNNYIR